MDKPKHNPSAKHTLDEVLKSLQDLVRNELADDTEVGAKPRRKTKRDSASAEGSDNGGTELYENGVADEQTVAAEPDADSASAPPGDDAVAEDLAPAALQTKFPLPNDAPITARQPKPKKKKPAVPEQTSLLWEDVPVLNEVVVLPADAAPAPERAREIAVRVVAKLNIELRKAGNATLDPVIIDRLEQLLREALIAAATEPRKP